MKRKEPEGGFNNLSLFERMKRAKKIESIESKVELRKKSRVDKENTGVDLNKRKSFKDFLFQNNSTNKSSTNKEEEIMNSKILEMKNKLDPKRQNNSWKKTATQSSSIAVNDNEVQESQLFPALISENDSDAIIDYSLKSSIKVF